MNKLEDLVENIMNSWTLAVDNLNKMIHINRDSIVFCDERINILYNKINELENRIKILEKIKEQ